MSRGRFITFEGGEGTGKSTHIRLLSETLRGLGLQVATTREPGGSEGAEQIRHLLVEGEPGRWDSMTEALLHFAARRDHLCRSVWPALAEGSWVLCDRFADSTVAYQGYGQGLPRDAIDGLYRLVVGDFRPDLTIVLDVPVEDGLRRAHHRGGTEDRYERMQQAFHERLRQGFLAIAEDNRERCVVIDATAPRAEVQAAVLATVRDRFGL